MEFRQGLTRTLMIGALLVACASWLARPVAAGPTGKVAGTVTVEGTGEALPGVQIVIDGTTIGTTTDLDGHYQIIGIKPGTYVLLFRFVGFVETRVENVQVILDKTTTIDIEMREEVIQGEEIVVTAERPIVQMDRTTTTSFVDEAEIQALPVVSIGQVVNLQAGVVDGHFRGGRTGEVAYLVNGVPINNPYSNSAAFEVEKNMVAGLEVISGVFNAEYGQAMSGVVNIVTKDVSPRWTGSFSSELGAIASGREVEYVTRIGDPGSGLSRDQFVSEMFPYYDVADFPSRKDMQLSLGGPLLRDKLGIRVTGRYWNEQGTVIGRRLFLPSDSSMNLNSGRPETWSIESNGDQEFVPSHNERYSFNGTLIYRISPKLNVEYNLIYQNGKGRGSNHQQKYVPDGVNRYFFNSQFHLVGLRYTVNNNSFATLNYSFLRDQGSSRLYDLPDSFDPSDPANQTLDTRLVADQLSGLDGALAFDVGGNDLFVGGDQTDTHTILGDYTNQVTRIHQVKAGFMGRFHYLNNGNFGIEIGSQTGWLPVPSRNQFGRDTLQTRPYELAAYIQDKMEFRNLIVNAGIRFDYFEPDKQIPVDWTQAGNLLIPVYDGSEVVDSTLNRKDGPARWQFSPRVGIAFPISAQGVIRFSAGLFFQIPQLSILFQNPNYEINPQASNVSFGNPALDPERTLHFEIGLQQQLTTSMGLELTMFSKDIRNLTGVEIRRDVETTAFFVRYINRDVGTSRGITLSLFQRPIGGISWDVDYTLQFADGTSSNPNEAFGRFESGQEEILTLTRLDWDRRHVLTNSITVAPMKALSVTLINRFQTGAPYTSERRQIVSYVENNLDRPSSFTSDLRLFWRPSVARGLSLTAQVDNLFDAMIHYGVYSDTGRGDESVDAERYKINGTTVGGVNSIDEYYYNQGWFSAPRRVTIGLRYDF